jgi:hypothetical protein
MVGYPEYDWYQSIAIDHVYRAMWGMLLAAISAGGDAV